MARRPSNSKTKTLKLNLAALGALLAAMMLVILAAVNSDGDSASLSAESRGELRLSLTLEERQEIFAEFMAEHCRGVESRDACRLVAEFRGLEDETVRRIVREGVSRGWPRG